MSYNDFKEKFKIFISDFDVDINLENKTLVCKINDEEVIMSSGFQALVRIFIEIFIYNTANNDKSLKYVVIDEIDQHLDNTICRIIMKKINELFPSIRIITTVHSLTFFEELENTKIISLDGKNYSYKILDPRDLGGLEYIDREVFNSYVEKSTGISRMNEIYMKVFNDIELTKKDKRYLKKDIDLSPDEKNMKAIILAEVDMEW
ncbi:MAG: hypothetical protein B6227_03330 [Fusobacteriia bacterium 4572_74]|nr:MAG: hypothetical protein B6227_03330 [Fusobacteriia bacterium 4572_74]